MMNTIETREGGFRLTFSLPKINNIPTEHKNKKRKSDIGTLVSDTSYPILSTNSFRGLGKKDFINYDTTVKVSRARKTKEENFRTRNRFIIARNVLGKAICLDKKDVNIISKIVSSVWRTNEVLLHDYFEYLSLLESNWYKCCRAGSNSGCKYLGFYDSLEWNMAYTSICSTSYVKPLSAHGKSQSLAAFPQKQKFRISKNVKFDKPKSKKKISLRRHDSFRIKNCLFDNDFEIFTEDIFLNM